MAQSEREQFRGKCFVGYYCCTNVERGHLKEIPESYGMTIAI